MNRVIQLTCNVKHLSLKKGIVEVLSLNLYEVSYCFHKTFNFLPTKANNAILLP